MAYFTKVWPKLFNKSQSPSQEGPYLFNPASQSLLPVNPVCANPSQRTSRWARFTIPYRNRVDGDESSPQQLDHSSPQQLSSSSLPKELLSISFDSMTWVSLELISVIQTTGPVGEQALQIQLTVKSRSPGTSRPHRIKAADFTMEFWTINDTSNQLIVVKPWDFDAQRGDAIPVRTVLSKKRSLKAAFSYFLSMGLRLSWSEHREFITVERESAKCLISGNRVACSFHENRASKEGIRWTQPPITLTLTGPRSLESIKATFRIEAAVLGGGLFGGRKLKGKPVSVIVRT